MKLIKAALVVALFFFVIQLAGCDIGDPAPTYTPTATVMAVPSLTYTPTATPEGYPVPSVTPERHMVSG